MLSEAISDAYLAELREDGVFYVFAGSDGRDLATAVDALGETFGVENQLLEGGTAINCSYLNAGLFDGFASSSTRP